MVRPRPVHQSYLHTRPPPAHPGLALVVRRVGLTSRRNSVDGRAWSPPRHDLDIGARGAQRWPASSGSRPKATLGGKRCRPPLPSPPPPCRTSSTRPPNCQTRSTIRGRHRQNPQAVVARELKSKWRPARVGKQYKHARGGGQPLHANLTGQTPAATRLRGAARHLGCVGFHVQEAHASGLVRRPALRRRRPR